MEQDLKQKQIEEMEIDIIKSLSVEYIYPQSEVMKNISDIKILISSLIAKGYRKIPENAVVLTMEELEENYVSKTLYKQLQEVSLARKGQVEKLSKKLVEARKETAEKYHELINQAIESVPNATKEFVQAWKAKNDEICEEFTGETK